MKPNASLPCIAAVAVAAFAPAAQATQCFSIFDARNTLVYQSTTAPVDLSGPVSNAMARRFPSRSLVIADSGVCREVGNGPASAATLRGESSSDGAIALDTTAAGGDGMATGSNNNARARASGRSRAGSGR